MHQGTIAELSFVLEMLGNVMSTMQTKWNQELNTLQVNMREEI